jgi:uncharacterized protein YndB with AHSA1/START domain/DNA-binding MarR family transcriptional regulator
MLLDHLNATFAALSDPTRRAILERLALGEASVNELAKPFKMSLTAVSKHLKVLEAAGLIARSRDAQKRPCYVETQRLKQAKQWIEASMGAWEAVEAETTRANELQNARANAFELVADLGYPSFSMRRAFNAPRRLVFDAWTKPEHLARWWASSPLEQCEIELRVGGLYRLVESVHTHALTGHFREVLKPSRLVRTCVASTAPLVESLETCTFEERAGKTTVTRVVLHKTVEARDAQIASGVEKKTAAAYERLAAYLKHS